MIICVQFRQNLRCKVLWLGRSVMECPTCVLICLAITRKCSRKRNPKFFRIVFNYLKVDKPPRKFASTSEINFLDPSVLLTRLFSVFGALPFTRYNVRLVSALSSMVKGLCPKIKSSSQYLCLSLSRFHSSKSQSVASFIYNLHHLAFSDGSPFRMSRGAPVTCVPTIVTLDL